MKNNIRTFTSLDVTLRQDCSTLWVFGCSHSYGVGLNSHEKNFGKLLAEQLDLPLRLIAWPGSSTQFSFRHLLNADIREGDIVVWQLTYPERFTYSESTFKITEVNITQNPTKKFLDFLQMPNFTSINCHY